MNPCQVWMLVRSPTNFTPGRSAGYEADLAHELPHQFGRALGLLGAQVGVDSAVSIGAVGLFEEVLNPGDQGLSPGRGR